MFGVRNEEKRGVTDKMSSRSFPIFGHLPRLSPLVSHASARALHHIPAPSAKFLSLPRSTPSIPRTNRSLYTCVSAILTSCRLQRYSTSTTHLSVTGPS